MKIDWTKVKEGFTYQDVLKEENKELKEESKQLKFQLQQKENTIKEAREKLKKHKHDLNYEPWSEYKIKGSILFDLVEILDKANDREDK